MKVRIRTWAQARMAPETWERTSELASGSLEFLNRLRAWFVSALRNLRPMRLEPWRIAFAAMCVAIPSAVFLLFDLDTSVAYLAIIMLCAVVLSVYVADLVGGFAAVLIGVAAVDLILIGDKYRFDFWNHEPATVVLFVLVSAFLIAIIEYLKYDRAQAKLDAAAMRAANTALTAVEIAASRRPAGDTDAQLSVLRSILTAMVQVNRADSGAMYLADTSGNVIVRAVVHGDVPASGVDYLTTQEIQELQLGEGFAGRVASERRALTVQDTLQEPDMEDVLNSNSHVRAVAGVPLIGPSDNIVGVAWIGQYAPTKFGASAIARMHALAHRTVAFMEAARIADVQEAKLDQAQDNQRRLQQVIQTMPEAVMVIRPPRGNIVASNAAAQRMFGLPRDPLIVSFRVDQLRVTSDRNESQPALTALETGEVITGIELSVQSLSGRDLPVIASAAPLKTETGEIDAVVAVFQDVTSLKEAERMRDEFVSIVSHELRSPLTPIRGFAQVVARELQREGGHDSQIDYLQTLTRHADRMTRLVDDLLDVSRLRAGRLEIRREQTDLVQLTRSIAESRQQTTTEHSIVVRTNLNDLSANVDGDRITQVLDNIIGNAVKYTDGGTVDVHLSTIDNNATARFVITDQGVGIPAEERPYLFNAFYRSRHASESAVQGLGLGLFICNELIQAHDGVIALDEAPGGGTQFTIDIPRNVPLQTRLPE